MEVGIDLRLIGLLLLWAILTSGSKDTKQHIDWSQFYTFLGVVDELR